LQFWASWIENNAYKIGKKEENEDHEEKKEK
jgi:hypothetical protein